MHTADFDYYLPIELIAQRPAEPRDSSRLLVLDRARDRLEHRSFREITEYLRAGDLLVANRSRVIPARLLGVKEATGTPVEMLLLRPAPQADSLYEWEVLLKPARRLRPGTRLAFGKGELAATVISSNGLGVRKVQLEAEEPLEQVVDRLGRAPLPPYIKEYSGDPERYQTVYADTRGSAAAPTAGLHFTPELLDRVREAGVHISFVTLHIGIDTFRPVQEDDPTKHPMHREYYEVPEAVSEEITAAKRDGRRVIAVGTTTVRVLESAANDETPCCVHAGSGWTDLFIYPGYRFKVVDALITNFHLPRSTLVMMVSALAGRERLLAAYREAVEQRYRFYSFGDAMLVI
ncbi:MAG: tRNA preQ1(34) S-adenosylmethionine ribosyltransferase-isomerase QueA [Chloroflexota bacterium]|jgi:S-adenosylmethionine:tRNA ribosyltransferase-isomerase